MLKASCVLESASTAEVLDVIQMAAKTWAVTFECEEVRFTYDEDGQLQADDFFTPYICELFSAHVIFDHAWAV